MTKLPWHATNSPTELETLLKSMAESKVDSLENILRHSADEQFE
jgi:hypothetical protein